MKRKKVVLKNFQSPGDLLMLTVAVRDFVQQYRQHFQVGVQSVYPEVFYMNPFIEKFEYTDDDILEVDYLYEFNKKKLTGNHFSDGFISDINRKLGLTIEKTSMRPEIYLTEEEKDESFLDHLGIKKPYWIFNAGFKNDMPIKAYPPKLWQEVINRLSDEGIQLIQTGHSHHNHPVFDGVKSLVGRTDNLRDYFSLMYHANGSIGAVSLQMHTASALNKPCVIIAGGREEWRWEAYQDHQFLHTIGQLSCCLKGGCWHKHFNQCKNLLFDSFVKPLCMDLITPQRIVEKVLIYEYYRRWK